MSGRPHVHPLFLPTELYIAICKAQAQLEIGKSAAILLMVNEGLHIHGLIQEQDYLQIKTKYERKLIEIVRNKRSQNSCQPDLKEQQLLKEKEKVFSMVLDQWNQHQSPQWRARWVNEARKYENRLPNARLILDLADKANSDI